MPSVAKKTKRKKNPAAVALGKLAAKKRKTQMTSEEARRIALMRWYPKTKGRKTKKKQ